MMHRHGRTRALVQRLFTGGLSPPRRRALFAGLAACERCAAYYGRFHALEDSLCRAPLAGEPWPAPAATTPFALERVEAALFAALATPAAGRRGAWSLGWAGAAAAAAAVVVLAVTLWPAALPQPDREALGPGLRWVEADLVARGGAVASPDVGLRVFRVAPTAGERAGEGAGDAAGGAAGAVAEAARGGLSLDDVITFTYTNVAADVGYLALFGVQAEGRILWYYPTYGGGESVAIASDRVDEPLGDGFRLSVNHTAGRLRVVGLFSAAPIDVAAIRDAVRGGRWAPGPDGEAAGPKGGGWPAAGAREHSLLLDVAPAPQAPDGGEAAER